MGDDYEHVVFYDETNPLEQSRRSILQYQSRPEADTTTYLVELPEKRIDAPRPSTRPARRSTIINTSQLPDTREVEERPLDEYVRRNLPSFRKSLTPEDLQHLQAQERYREGEVVRPATAENIQRAFMDNKKRKNKDTGSEQRENLPKHREKLQSVSFLDPTPHKLRNSNTSEDTQSKKAEKKKKKTGEKEKLSHNQYGHDFDPKNEVVVMPAMEQISVSNKSPFFKDPKSSLRNNRPVSPIKVSLSVESCDEDNRKGNNSSKRGKSDLSSVKRKISMDSNDDSLDEDDDRSKTRNKKQKHQKNSENPTFNLGESNDQIEKGRRRRRRKSKPEDAKRGGNKSRDSSSSSDDEKPENRKFNSKTVDTRSSSVCLSGESGENNSEPYIVNNPMNRKKHAANKSEKSADKDKKRSSKSSAKRDRKSEDLVDYTETTNPFGKQDPYSVHFLATKKGAAGKKTDQKKKQEKSKQKTGGEDPNKNKVKAPRSATKFVARRRYHIQIPEHGRPETWFNVRFNMNPENNVDMNYEGPIKINNYYASKHYL